MQSVESENPALSMLKKLEEIEAVLERIETARASVQESPVEREDQSEGDGQLLAASQNIIKFSIIVPTYNHAQFLPAALDSIINQTYPHWEAVVVNDGSTDETPSILNTYAERDVRIRVIHKENGGTASALNEAIRNATGDWICWLSSDDLFESEKLRIHAEAIVTHPQIRFFFSGFYYLMDQTGKKFAPQYNPPNDLYYLLSFFNMNYINGLSIAIHHSLFEELGKFSEKYRYAQDVEMWFRILTKYSGYYISHRLSTTRIHSAQATEDFPQAGYYDISWFLKEFLNDHSISALFPSIDITQPQNLLVVLPALIEVIVNPNAAFYSTGFSTALVERLHDWIYIDLKGKLDPIFYVNFEELVNNAKEIPGLPEKLKHSLNLLLDNRQVRIFNVHDFWTEFNEHLDQVKFFGQVDYAKALKRFYLIHHKELVSIIITTYNRPFLLIDALNSTISQTYHNFEIIVVNDCGENVEQILSTLSRNDLQITYVNHGINRGPSAARNTGLALARGEIICFLDDDDRFLPNHLETVVSLLHDPDVKFVYTNAYCITETIENGQRCDLLRDERYKGIPYSRERLLVENFIPINTWAFRRDLALKAGLFDESLYGLEDWDYLLRLTALTIPRLIDITTVEVRMREGADERVSSRSRPRFLSLYQRIYEHHPSVSLKVQAGREHMLTAFEKELSGQEDRYIIWFNRHRWSRRSCQYLKEISERWQAMPSIHILMITKEDHQALVNKTINCLVKQTLGLWNLTIIASADFDQSGCADASQINWLKLNVDQNFLSVLANVDINSKNDWLLVCEPGTCFEPVFCNLVGELIDRHPEWRFIYIDEDMIDGQGKFSKPSLKPAFNLDLLRSSGYIGHACLIHSDLWRHIPTAERTNPGQLLNYAAALRCHELFGEKGAGHIDQILFHHPLEIEDDLEKFEALGKLILQECLWRQGIFSEVTPGLLKGSFFVDYPLFVTPKISIIIPTRGYLNLLQPCIESLLQKTLYPDYEIIIVDNHSNDAETLEYLGNLPNLNHRIKIISYREKFNYSAINNLAAQQAQGDFLLLLNDDTVILQENWLQRLVAIGLREEVGVVGCRLLYPNQTIQHAGIILGLGGVMGHISAGLSMSEPGYMHRAQLMQNFSAVSAACMLVRKDRYFEVGGLDQKQFVVEYSGIDLCLRIGERGYKIVWTPFVNLVHHKASKQQAASDNKPQEPDTSSRQAFIKKWLHLLGNDPAYNRYLSLRQYEWMIDGDFDVPWHPDLEPLPRIVAQPPDTTGVGQYRMIGPLKALTDSGRICSFLLPPINSEARFLPFPSELARVKPTVLFLQNAFSHWHIGEVESYAELLPDIFRVFGQDDIVFSVPQKSSVHKLFSKDTKARLRKVASLCHRVIVTTQPIADAMRGMVDDIRVIPNYLERSRWGDLQPPRKERRKLRVGWAGAQQHQGDLEFIIPVVEATANEVDWIFMGMSLPKLRYHIAELHGPVSFDEYPAGLAALDLDLAIAPLEINRFNAAKSNLRLLEYGAVGYPVICTDIEPYRNAPVTCVSNNPKAWIDAIHAHIHDMDATRAAGEQLHDWVLSNWMLDQHLDEWMKMLLPD